MDTTTTGRIAPTPKAKRDLHPRAQLKYHHTCANRAQKKADWLRELADRHDATPVEDRYGDADYALHNRATAELLDMKVREHLRACVALNDEHALGFLITPSMRRTLAF